MLESEIEHRRHNRLPERFAQNRHNTGMASKSKPVETSESKSSAPHRTGQVRYSISKADLRERGIYEPRGLPLPNVADLMNYLLKGMVVFLIYSVVRTIWSESPASTPARAEQRAQLATPQSDQRRGDQKRSDQKQSAMEQLENLNRSINSATDSIVDQLRDFVRKDPTAPEL